MFKKLIGLFGSSSAKDPSAEINWVERRVHKRFDLDNSLCARLVLGGGSEFVINNLSYGGFLLDIAELSANQRPGLPKVGEKTEALLKILGRSVKVEFRAVYVSPKNVGASFVHSDMHILVFLREFLDRLSQGSTFLRVDKTILKDKFQAGNWCYYRGEGPTDLVIDFDEAAQRLNGVHLTVPFGERYYEIILDKERLVTCKGPVSSNFYSAGSFPDNEPDRDIIRIGLCIMFGIADQKLAFMLRAFVIRCWNLCV